MNSLLINIALRNGLTNKILLFTSISLFLSAPRSLSLTLSLFHKHMPHTFFFSRHFNLSQRVLSLCVVLVYMDASSTGGHKYTHAHTHTQ